MEPKHSRLAGIAVAIIVFLAAAGSFAAYKGHQDDRDSQAFLDTHPQAKGTRLDDCALCHRDGLIAIPDSPGATRYLNSCDYCHEIFVSRKRNPVETLNLFGRDYLAAGRGVKAFDITADTDSDADGFTNAQEIKALTLPGSDKSRPGLTPTSHRIVTFDEIKTRMPNLRQIIFMNSTKSRSGDTYSEYLGVRLIDVLELVGIPDSATSVDVISVDGYQKTFSIAELRKTYPQSSPVFGLSKKDIGDCGWVSYNAKGLEAGKQLADVPIILAFEADGAELPSALMDPGSGKLMGDGPFRVITPQQVKPGAPDLPETANPACNSQVPEKYRFDKDADHNSGNAARSVVAIRVNPVPAGYMDFNWRENALDYASKKELAVFGNLK